MISRIGEQSVSDNITALTEIIKNCYDADAETVHVKFYKDSISIQDDGYGITEKDLLDRYLVIGTDNKIRENTSPKGRAVLGNKGMGRFAAKKLGHQLKLESISKSIHNREKGRPIELDINWKKFENTSEYANEIKLQLTVHADQQESNLEKPGVTITIKELTEKWTTKTYNEFNKSILELLSPDKEDDKFDVFTYNNLESETKKGFPATAQAFTDMMKNAPYKISCEITKDFIMHYTIYNKDKKVFSTKNDTKEQRTLRIDKSYIDQPGGDWKDIICDSVKMLDIYNEIKNQKPSSDFLFNTMNNVEEKDYQKDFVGTFDFDLCFWPGKGGISSSPSADIDLFLKNQHGIKIFNDSGRVRPYGIIGGASEDWLNLSSESFTAGSRRKITFRNERCYGIIKLTKKNNPLIVETTSREKLENNAAYKSMILSVLTGIDKFKDYLVYETQNKKLKKAMTEREATKQYHAEGILDSLGSLKKQVKIDKPSSEEKQEIIDNVDFAHRGMKHHLAQLKLDEDERDQIDSLKRTHITIGTYMTNKLHDIRAPVDQIIGKLDDMMSNDFSNLPDTWKNLERDLGLLLNSSQLASSYANLLFKFTQGTSERAEKGKKEFNFNQITNEFIEYLVDLEKEQSDNKTKYKVNGDRALTMYRNDFFVIILNFFTNSIKAMQNKKQKEITVNCSTKGDNLVITWADTGYGVEKADMEIIFEPYRRGKKPIKEDEDHGSGLGLSNIRDAIEFYNGKIILKENKPHAVFEITIPLNQLQK
jgi:signal transduction histidine kinase